MAGLEKLKALVDGLMSHILLQEEREKARQRVARRRVLRWEGIWLWGIDEGDQTMFLDLAVDAMAKIMVVVKNAFDKLTVSIKQIADVLGAFAEALAVIEQAETRQRVLDWEGVWLWD